MMLKYMDYVTKLANKNVDEGGQPFGACIVFQGEIIAEGVNETHFKNDVTRHAELIAIEIAQEKLNTMDLSECTLYASGHPCPMCMGAIGFSNIKDVFYGNSLEDAKDAGLGLSQNIYDFIKGDKEALELKFDKVELEIDPMQYYKEKK